MTTPTPEQALGVTADELKRQWVRDVRLVWVVKDLLSKWGARTIDGALMTAEWGEPDEHGVYTPMFTRHDDDNIAAKAVREWLNSPAPAVLLADANLPEAEAIRALAALRALLTESKP